MSYLKRASVLGAIALLSVACSQQEAPTMASAPAAPLAPAPAPALEASQPPAVMGGLQALTADQLAEQRADAPSSCNIEGVNGIAFNDQAITVARGSVDVTGWFLAEKSKISGMPASIRVVDQGNTAGWEIGIGTWLPRADVTTAMLAVDQGNVGFAQALDLSSMAPGKYSVSIVFSEAGAKYACQKFREIEIQ